MATAADGNAISDWWALIDDALAARTEAEVDAIIDRMDGWPTIIDVEEYVEDEQVRAEFSARVERLERHVADTANGGDEDVADALHGLVSMLTAT